MPVDLLRPYVIPIDKPGKDPASCKSKRPISLICALAKALESVACNRMLPLLEPKLNRAQYAYRRARGVEFHLLELHRFLQDATCRGRYVYLASLDIEGAFDTAPHDRILKILGDFRT